MVESNEQNSQVNREMSDPSSEHEVSLFILSEEIVTLK